MQIRLALGSVLMAALIDFAPWAPALAANDGRAILDMCDGRVPGEELAALAGGVAFGMAVGQGLGGPQRQFCPPNNGRISNGQYRRVVCKFIADHPQLLNQESYTAISVALLRSYPCQSGLPPP